LPEKSIRQKPTLYFATVVHCIGDPWVAGAAALRVIDNGYLKVVNGLVDAIGAESDLTHDDLSQCMQVDYRGNYIVPGFIDGHLHYPQIGVIGSYGEQLIEWLQKYAFPAEAKFSDPVHAASAAEFFIQQLLRNGTTSALVYATVHKQSVDALFSKASAMNMRLATGKVMMDRNCPENLRDTAVSGYEDSQALIDKWHGKGRLSYAVTPRFAPTSTEEQLEFTSKLFNDSDGVYLQSHVAENKAEVEWVAELFPWSRSYLDIYDHYGLLGERAVYGHCIYLDDTDLTRMSDSGTVAAFCPTSNLFLGSGLFDLVGARDRNIKTVLSTDVGGGTSFSMLRTADEAYKVTQLAGNTVTPLQLFYELTLGGATALSIDSQVGNFTIGKEADFVVLDPNATEIMSYRMDNAQSIEEVLFAFLILGDDRCTLATHVMGEAAYNRTWAH